MNFLSVQFAQYCQPAQNQAQQPSWILKPLFFEVPQRDSQPIFIGRNWLFGEIMEHLTSELPTNRGVVISGAAGTGKTSVILKLVEMSCFGRGEPIYQGWFDCFSQVFALQPEIEVCSSVRRFFY
jgi:hypothetical protein